MKKLETDMLIIGGGATGTGAAWDAALRGLRVILAEKRDLTHGTTGRYHGLLHSGGRYVVKDPASARECIQENRILRRTHSFCIEDTGGFFVVTPEDEGDYPDQFFAACAKEGIPCEEISVAEALRQEPRLNPAVSRVFRVPDASADSFLATRRTAAAAAAAGAAILTYHELIRFEITNGKLVGAVLHDLVQDEFVHVTAGVVINATGAWAGQVTKLAGIEMQIIPGKGVMAATNYRPVNTILNRCKMPDDGDIIVPVQTVAVLGTTDERVTDPEHLQISPWEIELILREADKLVPGISNQRILRAWAGVRPLYQANFAGESRDATRSIALLDHLALDGLAGLITITGGKWTTFRLMAEEAVDAAAKQLNNVRPCRTAETVVAVEGRQALWPGLRLQGIEQTDRQHELICECELVTRSELEQLLVEDKTVTLDDIRRELRLGMGPCQGGFCSFRTAALCSELAVDLDPNLLLEDFLQERWKGVRPILWGQQLQQERLDQLIYLSLLNTDHLPQGGKQSPLSLFYRES